MSSSGGSSRQRNCNACVRSKRRCDKGQPACGRCVKQRYPCVYGGRRRADMALGGSADATFSLDCRGDPNPASGTFMPTDAISTMLGTDMNLLPDATFHLNNDFSSLLAPIPGTNSFLSDSWASQFTELSSIPREKALVRKDYSKMTPMCVCSPSSLRGNCHSKPIAIGRLCTLATSRPIDKSCLHRERT